MLRPGDPVAQVTGGIRGARRVKVLGDIAAGRVDLRVPGRTVEVGYDRLSGGSLRGYAKAQTVTLAVEERYDERYGYVVLTGCTV